MEGSWVIIPQLSMADNYRIHVESLSGDKARFRIALINPQAADVPANACLGFQLLLDAFLYLRDFPGELNLAPEELSRLRGAADSDIRQWSTRIALGKGNAELKQELIDFAESRVRRVRLLESLNFERAHAWHAALERAEDVPPFESLAIEQTVEVEVIVPSTLAHLVEGLSWQTRMFPRDDRYP